MLTFDSFDIQKHHWDSGCPFDYMEVSYDSFSQRYCGSSIPGPFTSTGSSMVVRFHSDDSNTRTGFSAVWTEV